MNGLAFRSGFVALLGRPNSGKSTLLNQLCGEKIAITSSKPQTTRNRILGVLHRPGFQAVFIDTPGLHAHDKALNRYMQEVVRQALKDVDAVVYVADATRRPGPEEEQALGMLAPLKGKVPVLLAMNKTDAAAGSAVEERIGQLTALFPFSAAVPLSALKGKGIAPLVEDVAALLPPGPPFFPPEMVTDQPLSFRLAEIVREKVFDLTRQEVPYGVAVVVENIVRREDGLVEVYALIYVERESQKAILVGKGASMIKKIGIEARRDMEGRLGAKVFLDLRVKVKEGWTDREDLLRQLGYR